MSATEGHTALMHDMKAYVATEVQLHAFLTMTL